MPRIRMFVSTIKIHDWNWILESSFRRMIHDWPCVYGARGIYRARYILRDVHAVLRAVHIARPYNLHS